MLNISKSSTQYTERQVADLLGISVVRLHELLEEHIFNDGTPRPSDLTFTNPDLLLLKFWQRVEAEPETPPSNLLTMAPRRPWK